MYTVIERKLDVNSANEVDAMDNDAELARHARVVHKRMSRARSRYLTAASERRDIIRVMRGRGWSYGRIATLFDTSRTVIRQAEMNGEGHG